jgi:hypothetical protein
VAGPSAPACWVVAGTLTGILYTADWFWDEILPKEVKQFILDTVMAEGVFDWQTLYDPIFKFCVESHANAVRSADAAWDEMRRNAGLPPSPSPAGAFLNDWINRNGWRDGALVHFKVAGKQRWMKLEPESAPWAISWSPSMPKRAREGGKVAFAQTIVNLLHAHRLSVLQRAMDATMAFVALSLTGTTWKVDAGPVREAAWIHGTAVTPERRSDLSDARVFGSGARFHARSGKQAWFHAQIPTPAVIDEARPVCTKVFLMFQTHLARLEALHVYDGAHKIASFDNLAFEGDHSLVLDAANARLLFPFPTIHSGLGLSALFRFGTGLMVPGDRTHPWVHFSAAGADFNRSA